MLPLVTVISLTYNNHEKLGFTITSILEQNYPSIQLIISDDASDNQDFEEIAKAINDKKRANIIKVDYLKNERNIGTVKHANKALKHAQGELIKFLSPGDSFYNPDSLAILVSELMKSEASALIAQTLVSAEMQIPNSITAVNTAMNGILKYNDYSPGELLELLLEECFINTTGSIFRKEIFEKYGLFDESYKLMEDWPTWIKLIKNGEKIKFIQTVAAVYTLGGLSTAKSALTDILLSDIHLLYEKEILEIAAKLPLKKRYGILFLYNRISAKKSGSLYKKAKFIIKYAPYLLAIRIPKKIKKKLINATRLTILV